MTIAETCAAGEPLRNRCLACSEDRPEDCTLTETEVRWEKVTMPLADVLARWRPGSYPEPWTWEDERSDVWAEERTTDLIVDIHANGIREPVLLGTTGVVWDGHHRLCIAYWLSIEDVPVERAVPA